MLFYNYSVFGAEPVLEINLIYWLGVTPIREWFLDYPETEIHHRHVSHLYGLYPGNLITEKPRSFWKPAGWLWKGAGTKEPDGVWHGKYASGPDSGTGNMHWGFWKNSSVIPGRKIFPVWEAAFIPTCCVHTLRSRLMGTLALQLQLQRCLSRAGRGISCCFRHFRLSGKTEMSGEWRYRVTSQLISNGEMAGYTGFASALPVSRK